MGLSMIEKDLWEVLKWEKKKHLSKYVGCFEQRVLVTHSITQLVSALETYIEWLYVTIECEFELGFPYLKDLHAVDDLSIT